MAAKRTVGVKKKQKYSQFLFNAITLSKSYKLNSTKMTNNKSYKLKHPKNN